MDFERTLAALVGRRYEHVSIGQQDQFDEDNESGDEDRKKDADAEVAHLGF